MYSAIQLVHEPGRYTHTDVCVCVHIHILSQGKPNLTEFNSYSALFFVIKLF